MNSVNLNLTATRPFPLLHASIETESSRQAAENASKGLAEDVKAPIGFFEVKQGDPIVKVLLPFSSLLHLKCSITFLTSICICPSTHLTGFHASQRDELRCCLRILQIGEEEKKRRRIRCALPHHFIYC